MEMEIVVPGTVPAMTLPDVAFFPQALLPLHIFEPRYRRMLQEVLNHDRLFAVAGLDARRSEEPDVFEPPHRIATLGIVRACQKQSDGTSNLLLQGLCRVEIIGIVSDEPYRQISIRALHSTGGEDPAANQKLRRELGRLLALKRKYGATLPEELTDFLRTVEDPETFVDLAAFSLCEDAGLKQRLLETLDVRTRLQLFNRRLRQEINALRLRHTLQGPLADDQISHN
jgi:ATP-dependent Lon protease